jgi:hypothetical protein
MASTTFIDQQTVILASWLNDVNNTVYNGNFPNGTINCTQLNATSATISNLTASIGTLSLTNNWQIVAGASTLQFINNGITVATLDTSGNLELLGSVVTGTTP